MRFVPVSVLRNHSCISIGNLLYINRAHSLLALFAIKCTLELRYGSPTVGPSITNTAVQFGFLVQLPRSAWPACCQSICNAQAKKHLDRIVEDYPTSQQKNVSEALAASLAEG